MATIAMMTDFGLKDGNVGVMKGVIVKICRDVQVVDVSHLISPQDIAEAALILQRTTPYFPEGTIHLVVVDPGVGTQRRPMLARLGGSYYVGPDNGTITMWLEGIRAAGRACEFFELNRPEYWLPQVSHVFHGRDVFAPSAAHLANGVPPSQLGTPISDPVELPLPRPTRRGNAWRGEVIHIDHFGNIATSIRTEHIADALDQKEQIAVHVAGTRLQGLVDTFGDREPGALIGLLGSTGNLIVSVVNGNAATRLGAKIGDAIEVELPPVSQRGIDGVRQ